MPLNGSPMLAVGVKTGFRKCRISTQRISGSIFLWGDETKIVSWRLIINKVEKHRPKLGW
jgi:hypothetical protein